MQVPCNISAAGHASPVEEWADQKCGSWRCHDSHMLPGRYGILVSKQMHIHKPPGGGLSATCKITGSCSHLFALDDWIDALGRYNLPSPKLVTVPGDHVVSDS